MSSYYKVINGQPYDRSLLSLAESLVQGRGDGRISKKDARKLYEAMQDGQGITEVEQATMAYIRKQFNLTDSARMWLSMQPMVKTLAQTLSEVVKTTIGASQLAYSYDEAEVRSQQALPQSNLHFVEAFTLALETILQDEQNLESPRGIIREIYGLFPDQVEDAEAQLQQKLRAYLQTGELILLPNVNWDNWRREDGYYPPENRESAADNWIFYLRLPQLSDHLFWIVIDRTGTQKPFLYGFN